CGGGHADCGSLGALRDPLSLAVSALLFDRLALSRRLRACGNPHATRNRAGRLVNRAPDSDDRLRADPRKPLAALFRNDRESLRDRRVRARRDVPLLRCAPCPRANAGASARRPPRERDVPADAVWPDVVGPSVSVRLTLAAALLALAACSRPQPPLEILGTIPAFTLTSHTGQSFESQKELS